MTNSQHVYEVHPRSDKRGVDLISDTLPFGRLWYLEVSDAIGYAKFRSRSHHAVIRVYDEAGNVIETHEHVGDFKEAKGDARRGPKHLVKAHSSPCFSTATFIVDFRIFALSDRSKVSTTVRVAVIEPSPPPS